jgi:hypothetical protein
MKKYFLTLLTLAVLALSALAFDGGLPPPLCDPKGHCIPGSR